jgi:polyhydroxyalkanoate synthesis repressor PhaR
MARTSASKGDDGDTIIIKKYANRRLYNTQTSKYITLDFLAELTRKEQDFKVVDARTGEDITHNVLTQIIMEEESNGQNLLPVNFLKQIIAMYGNSMQGMVPPFLEGSMANFRASQDQMKAMLEGSMQANPLTAPLAEMAKRNMELMKSFAPGFPMPSAAPEPEPASADEPEVDVESLKQQMAALQAQIEKLSQK